MLPDSIELTHRGLVSDRKECLEWVSANLKEPNVGPFAMMCGSYAK